MKFVTEWTYSLLFIAFLINFHIVLRRITGQNVLEILYNGLLDFGIIINIDILK